MTRLLSAALVIVLSVAAGAAGVARANGLDTVAEELRQDFVYVDPDAERALSTQEADEVRDAIREADTPIYIAVLPESAADVAGGDPAEVARQLSQAVGRPGTYGVVVGDSFRAGSSELPSGEAGQLATDALDSGGDDTTSVLVEFAGLVGGAVAADESGSGGSESGDGDGGSGTSIWLPILLVVGAAAIGYWVWRNSKRRQAQAEEQARAEAADRQLLQAELSVLADDVVTAGAGGGAASGGTERLRRRRQSVSSRAGSARVRRRTGRSRPRPARRRRGQLLDGSSTGDRAGTRATIPTDGLAVGGTTRRTGRHAR